MRLNKLLICLILWFLSFLNFLSPLSVKAATLLTDDFTGTTINTSKWSELDAGGAGGSSGNVQQNGSLTIANSFVSSTWGQTALYSVDTFDSSGLEIQALLAPVSDTLLGYGDYNFQTAGTSAFILDIQAGGNTLALSWNNGGFDGATSCGSDTGTKTYKIKIISGGFEVYKNGSLLCTHNTAVTINNKKVFLEASTTTSTFDDVLVTGTSAPTEPGAPTGLTADPGSTQIGLVWTAPASTGGSAITDYLVEYKLSSEPTTWSTFADGTSTSTSTTVTGLTNSLSYDFRVSAINAIGTGTASGTTSATPTAPTVPGAPTGLSASNGNAQSVLTWTAPVITGGAAITDYTVEYKLSTEPTTWSTFADGTSASTGATVTGLTNGLTYNFRVKAVNSVGTGSASSTANATPVAIGNVLVDNFTGTTIDTDKWTEVDPTGAGGSSGKIQQNGSLTIADSYNGAWGITALVSNETFVSTSLEISATMTAGSSPLIGYGDYLFGDSSNKAYLLYITAAGSGILGLVWENGSYAQTNCGSADAGAAIYKMKIISGGFEVYKSNNLLCTVSTSVVINNKPIFLENSTTASTYDDILVYGTASTHTAPGAPVIGTATAGDAQASVTFSAPSSNGGSAITGYTVMSSPGGLTGTGSSSPITVTGLTNGVAYTFTVTATNAIGTSDPSSASNSATPTAPPPPGQVTGLEATGFNKQVLLGWDAPGSGGSVTDYLIEYKLSSAGSWSTFADGTSTTKKAIVTGLTNGSAYDFRVSAVNSQGSGTPSATDSATPNAISNLSFVITGESNSGGIGLNSAATAGEIASRSAVQILELTSGNFLFENLDIGTNNLRDHDGLGGYYDCCHGLELQLANSTEAHAFPDNEQVYLIKTGQGGSQVSQWNYAGAYFTKFLQRTAAAKTQIPSDRKWVVWMSIGINDGIAGTNINTFKSNLTTYIDNIKADLPGAVIIMTQFQSMPASSGYPTINTALADVAALEPNVYVVDTTAATGTDGANHWTYAGLKTVANLMITTTKNVLGLNYPGLPTSLSATPSGTSVALSWTAPVSNGGSAITDYLVEYKANAGSIWSTFADGTSTTTSATVTGLSGSTAYNFRVSTINANGAGNYESANATTTDASAPTISSVSSTPSNTSTTIIWTTDEASSSIVDYGLTNSYGTSTSEADTSPRVTSHSVTINSLVACTTYNYRVKSNDASSNLATGSNNTFTTTGCTGDASVESQDQSSIPSATGGSLSLLSSSYGLALTVPAGATDTDAIFQIKKINKTQVLTTTSTPSGKNAIGDHTYELKSLGGVGSANTSFNEPITVTITYSDADVSGINESSMVIYRWNGTTWSPLTGCTIDTNANSITCTTTNFSTFGLFGTSNTVVSNFSGNSGHPFIAIEKIIPVPTDKSIIKNHLVFTKNLVFNSKSLEVQLLQKFLNTHGFTVSKKGAGSPGRETIIYGPATKAAVKKFQKKYSIPQTGNVGPLTRAKIKSL